MVRSTHESWDLGRCFIDVMYCLFCTITHPLQIRKDDEPRLRMRVLEDDALTLGLQQEEGGWEVRGQGLVSHGPMKVHLSSQDAVILESTLSSLMQ